MKLTSSAPVVLLASACGLALIGCGGDDSRAGAPGTAGTATVSGASGADTSNGVTPAGGASGAFDTSGGAGSGPAPAGMSGASSGAAGMGASSGAAGMGASSGAAGTGASSGAAGTGAAGVAGGANPPTYLQIGATAIIGTTPASEYTKNGVSADLIVNADTQSGGGCHYFWVATGVKGFAPVVGGTIFLQMGYFLCGAVAHPFVYSEYSMIPSSTGWLYESREYPLKSATWYRFSMSSDGVKRPDGTYSWTFYVQPRGGTRTAFASAPFETPLCTAGYVISEVAGSRNACADTFDVSYEHLMELKGGVWQESVHAYPAYDYGPCANSYVKPQGTNQLETLLGPSVFKATSEDDLLW